MTEFNVHAAIILIAGFSLYHMVFNVIAELKGILGIKDTFTISAKGWTQKSDSKYLIY